MNTSSCKSYYAKSVPSHIKSYHFRPGDHKSVFDRMYNAKAGIGIRMKSKDNAIFNYKSGILSKNTAACQSSITDHAVSLEGYADDYWLIRNSWGPDWGINGFIKIERDKSFAYNKQCFCGGAIESMHCSVGGLE